MGDGEGVHRNDHGFFVVVVLFCSFKRTLSSFYGIPVNLQALDTR